ncbi:diguanylate cyclase domain-containing protein [Simiduia litorea]|uniref:diguanylate cyclase domain-containing protein n=1 Tax=Simiduia litorea TaxID=1435348 RepID=UPI0036F33C43
MSLCLNGSLGSGIVMVNKQGNNEEPDATGSLESSHHTSKGEALARTQAELNNALSSLSDILYQTDAAGTIMMVSGACEAVLGYQTAEIIGRPMASFYCDQDERLRLLNEMLRDGVRDREVIAALRHKQGHEVWVATNVHLVFDAQGQFLGSQGIARDYSERKRQQAMLEASELQYRTLYEMTSDAVMLLDEDGFFDCNRATVTLFGCASIAEFCSKHPADFSPERQPDNSLSTELSMQRINDAMAHGSNRFEWLHKRADNHDTFYADVQLNSMKVNGRVILQAVVRDISRLKEGEEKAQQLAFYDPLTGLANRRLMDIKLDQALAECKRNKCWGALIFMDLDFFKKLNDAHGHAAGDHLLVQVAERLKHQLREVDTLVRYGGDEYIVILSQIGETEKLANAQAMLVAEKLRAEMAKPFFIQTFEKKPDATGIEFESGASFGVQLFSGDQLDPSTILNLADRAMYQAKRAGRNYVSFGGQDKKR